MKRLLFACLFLCVFLVPLSAHTANYVAFYSSTLGKNEVRFIFLGSAGVIINARKKTIVIDPGRMLEDSDIAQLKKGGLDLILFTHNHGDHYNSATAAKLFKATGAPVLAQSLTVELLSGKIPVESIKTGLPGKTYTFWRY
jgi:L-ascorbate metabolism protein UlaG (beta-lactamase superfamily)